MNFIYVLQLLPHYKVAANWTDETNKILGEHWNYLVGLNEKGIIKLVARTDYNIDNDDNRGIAVFEAADTESAETIMNNDPCIVKGVMTGALHPLRVVIYGGEIIAH
ncbi:MAG: hypothetical protein JWO06_406 [Bacteroidota bacterium]|nr:hypothetical protein [Bacteroidota bacterium]